MLGDVEPTSVERLAHSDQIGVDRHHSRRDVQRDTRQHEQDHHRGRAHPADAEHDDRHDRVDDQRHVGGQVDQVVKERPGVAEAAHQEPDHRSGDHRDHPAENCAPQAVNEVRQHDARLGQLPHPLPDCPRRRQDVGLHPGGGVRPDPDEGRDPRQGVGLCCEEATRRRRQRHQDCDGLTTTISGSGWSALTTPASLSSWKIFFSLSIQSWVRYGESTNQSKVLAK